MANTHFSKTADTIYSQHTSPTPKYLEGASQRAKRDYKNLQIAKEDFDKVVSRYNNLRQAEKDPTEGKKIRMASRKLRIASLKHGKSDANYRDALSKQEKNREIAVNREIAKDTRIKGKEAKAIRGLLKGRKPKRTSKKNENPFGVKFG